MFDIKKLSLIFVNSTFFLVTIFVIFLTPFSFFGLSANYSFIFYPLLLIFLTGKIKKVDKNLILIFLFYFSLLLISTFYQHELFEFFDRRLVSFIIFMTLFSYIAIDIDKKKIDAFKIAIVLIIIYFAIIKLEKFFFYTAQGKINLKFYVGSNRYGFVYLLAFWIMYFFKPTHQIIYIFKFLIISLIVVGIFLTYSRSTILALILSYGFYYFKNFVFIKKKFILNKILFFFLIPIFLFLLLNFIHKLLPNNFEFLSENFYKYFSLEGIFALSESIENINTSEGFRVYLLGKIFNYVILSPLIGSGFLGCWIMFDGMHCSAHNQYADVLFRVGFFGFYFYILILFKVFKFLKKQHSDLFYGFLSIIIFGFFHETFKLSHGAFILTFFLGMVTTEQRYKKF